MEAGARAGNGDCLTVVGRRGWKWLALAIALALVCGIYFGAQRFRYRFVRSNEDVLRLLPNTGATVFFAEVSMLRRAGYLRLLAGAKPSQDKDYARFLQETGFDYAKDLSAIAGSVEEGRLSLALRGRFDWPKVQRYVLSNRGNCAEGMCRMPTSTVQRVVSLRMIQPDVLALAIGGDAAGAEQIRPRQNSMEMASSAPVWVRPSRTLLMDPAELPLAARIFAISLQSADSLVLSLERSEAQGAAFAINVQALFINQAAAETARDQLARSTQMMKLEFAREHKAVQPNDLGWLLTSGSFQVDERRLSGTWLVRRELLEFLQ